MHGPTQRHRVPTAATVLLIVMLQGCGQKSSPIHSDSFPASSYADPIVNPADSTIAFQHTPLLRITRRITGFNVLRPQVEYSYQYAESAAGLWLAKWDGSSQRRVDTNGLHTSAWSADGKSLLEGGRSVPWDGQSLDEAAAVELSGVGSYLDPTWNKAMTKIVMWQNSQIFVWTAGTAQISAIGEVGWIQPDWSPDGSRIVFHGYVDQNAALMVSDSSGTNPYVLIQGMRYLDAPKWSPDGSRIAFVGAFGNEPIQLWTVRPDGTGLSQITTDGAQVHISWSPSGNEIIYVHYNSGELTCSGGTYSNGTIWRVNPTTRVRHQITFNTGLECP